MLTTYELPLNEKVRTLLRLEFLFKQINYTLTKDSKWDSRFTISSLLEINNMLSRIDLISELSKELSRQKQTLVSLSSLPEVDTDKLHQTILLYDNYLQALHQHAGQNCISNELLKAIQQRDSIPGGTCDFDLPIYHHWLSLPSNIRTQQLMCWLESLTPYKDSIQLILQNLRDSTLAQEVVANDGFYQQSISNNPAYQLIRVGLPEGVEYYPELSGGKHRFSVRMMHANIYDKPLHLKETVNFHLSCCLL